MKWWQERTPRERLLLAVMGGLLAALFLYQLVYRPVADWRAAAERRYSSAQGLARDMAVGAAEAKALKSLGDAREAGTAQAGGASVRVTITSSAHQAQVKIARLQPGEGTLTVWIDEVDAQALQLWITQLHETYGIAVSKATIRRHDDRPVVRAQLSFATGEAG